MGEAMERGHIPDVSHGQVLDGRWSRARGPRAAVSLCLVIRGITDRS